MIKNYRVYVSLPAGIFDKELCFFFAKYSRAEREIARRAYLMAPKVPQSDQSMALKWNSPPSLMPDGQREVTVLVRE